MNSEEVHEDVASRVTSAGKGHRQGTIAIIAVVVGSTILAVALGYLIYTSYRQQKTIDVLSRALTAQIAQFDVCKGGDSATNPACQNPVAPAPDKISEGTVGPPGPQGPQGIQGQRGFDGLPGFDGAQGKTGPQGKPGKDGATGEQGPAGTDGKDGADGEPGPKGDPGTDGADGQDGADGRTPTDLTCVQSAEPGNGFDCVVTAWR